MEPTTQPQPTIEQYAEALDHVGKVNERLQGQIGNLVAQLADLGVHFDAAVQHIKELESMQGAEAAPADDGPFVTAE